MGWVKYRQKFSSGHGYGENDWIFRYFPHDETDEDIEEFANELNEGYSWSVHYRGCDVVRCDAMEVPLHVYDKNIKDQDRSISYAQDKRSQLFSLLSKKQLKEFNSGS